MLGHEDRARPRPTERRPRSRFWRRPAGCGRRWSSNRRGPALEERRRRRRRFVSIASKTLTCSTQEEEREPGPGQDPDRGGPLRPGGKVEVVRAAHRGETGHVDPIERHAQDGRRGDPEHRQRAVAEARLQQQGRREQGAQQDLDPEVGGIPGGRDEQAGLSGDDDPREADHQVEGQDVAGDPAEAGDRLHRLLGAVEPVHHDRNPADGQAAEADRRDEEQEGQQIGVPERVQAVGSGQEERAEGGLVQGGKADPGDDEDDAELLEKANRPVEVELLQDRMAELDGQHTQVEHDAPGDLEERRMELPERHGKYDAPPDADVEGEAGGDARVTHQPQQHRAQVERLVAFPVEDAHEGGKREAGAPDRHQGHHSAALPQAPGHQIGQRDHGAWTVNDAERDHRQSRSEKEPQNRLYGPDIHDRSARWLPSGVLVAFGVRRISCGVYPFPIRGGGAPLPSGPALPARKPACSRRSITQ